MNGFSILIVDDDAHLAALIGGALKKAGYRTHHEESADAAVAYLKAATPDLLLLDIRLPGISGLKLLELLKQEPKTAGLPVIMTTTEGGTENKVKGLTLGADDYLVKPFDMAELMARVAALLRRAQGGGKPQNLLEAGGIRIDLDRRQVSIDEKHVALTAGEFDLLAMFLRRKGHVMTYENLRESLAQGSKDLTTGDIHGYMKRLRAKLGAAGERIETIYASGYRFLDS